MVMKSTSSTSTPASQKKAPAANAKKPVAKKKPAVKAVTPRKKKPTDEDISQKAHEIYLERMRTGEPGDSESDWHKALKLLKG
jgi:hypothetical protein